MPSRRTYLASSLACVTAATAGCVGFVTGDEPLEFEAARAEPTDDALETADFQEEQIREEEIEEVVDVGVDREIHATFWIAAYSHDADLGTREDLETQAAAFTAVSVPGMKVMGSQQNPIADMSNEELIDQFRDDIQTEEGTIREVEFREEYSVEVLDEERTVDVFDAVAERNGQTYDVALEVARFEHDGDILILAGVFPQAVTDDPPIDDLMASVQHPA